MNTTVSNFFSRDAFLKRQSRTSRTRKTPSLMNSKSCHNLRSEPLNIIPEEDESRLSASSRSPSPLKAKRRHANVTVSDIRVARDAFVHHDNDISEHNRNLLSAPRPAPRPPAMPSSSHSPDSFSLTFPDMAFNFPHPPIPTPSSLRAGSVSPTPSMSTSSSSSPGSHTSGLPTTPSSSDDEYAHIPSPRAFNPRRASIKPLFITKHNALSTPPSDDCRISASLLQPFKNAQEQSAIGSQDESEPESDCEWYTREFSQILSMCSPLPPSFPREQQPSRPESLSVPLTSVFSNLPPSPSPASRAAKATPTGPNVGYPSAQLDPAFPRRRRSRSIPKHAPPPVPPIPAHLRSNSSSSCTSSSDSHNTSPSPSPTKVASRPKQLSLRRPPPRSSIPADCVFDDDDSISSFSFSLYEDREPAPVPSPSSVYSQPSFHGEEGAEVEFAVDDIQFDLDIDLPMRLPLSLPGSPIDLEADIATGLEELRMERLEAPAGFDLRRRREERREVSVVMPPVADELRGLKSKWSSSTLSSLREEHEHRSAGSKLRLYFGGSTLSTTKQKRASGKVLPPPTPMPMSPTKRFRHQQMMRESSDVMVIGFNGVRRSGSVSTSSDAGSEESASSTGSGLRRKPIPVEMFLRSGA